ncbi:hypothetical protein [Mesorhizobium sp.]|uniref:hypothetical protein n=1 Tax=Mesorhizobium sp. TaxID=1871066 RepID=UPI000FE66970|nr:hypothetical protein [Mesorhizobium sp.]RWE37455.1 MAG: hypothetical protein EOS77_02430 [Mesorhizobium sp.]
MQKHEQEARDEHYRSLLKFHKEVWGWLVKRGLVDPADDEWRGFKEIIEEHEDEIEAAARRATEVSDATVEAALAAWRGTAVKNGDERPAMRNAIAAALQPTMPLAVNDIIAENKE